MIPAQAQTVKSSPTNTSFLIHAAAVLTLFLVQVAALGYAYSMPTHAELLPILKHNRNPALYVNDWRVQLDSEISGTRGMYSYIHSKLSKPFPLPEFEFVLFVLVGVAMQAGIYRLGWLLFQDWRSALLAGLMLISFYVALSGEVLVTGGPNITSDIAKLILIWAIVLYWRHPFRFSVAMGIAALVHISFGGVVMLAYGLVNLFPLSFDRRWIKRQAAVVGGFAVGTLPLWVDISAFFNRTQTTGSTDYVAEILLMRIPWHIDHFRNVHVLAEWALLIVIFYVCSRQHTGAIHAFTKRLFAAGIVICLFEFALNNPFLRVDAVVQFRFVRIAQFMMLLSLMYLANQLVKTLDHLPYPYNLLVGMPIVGMALYVFNPEIIIRGRDLPHKLLNDDKNFYLLASALVFVLLAARLPTKPTHLGWTLPLILTLIFGAHFVTNPPRYMFTEEVAIPQEELFLWIRDHTEQDAIFVVPTLEERFQVLSERAVVADFVNVPYPFFGEWIQRIFDILGITVPEGESIIPSIELLHGYSYWITGYNSMDETRARFLREKYGADYLLIDDDVRLDFEIAHECCGMVLYSLDED